jgi:hypothetical protein
MSRPYERQFMINVKTKSQSRLPVQQVRRRTTFQVLSHGARGGSKGVIMLAVPKAGRVSAAGSEIKDAKVAAAGAGRVTLEVELTSAARRAVKRHGRIRAYVRLSYVPRGGRAITKMVPMLFGP